MVSYISTLNVDTTPTSVLKDSGSDSYTDNYAETQSIGTSGTVSIEGTPSAVDGKNYVLGINEGWTSGVSTADSMACWNGAGTTGRAYCLLGDTTTHHTQNGIATTDVLKIEYNWTTATITWYVNDTQVAIATSGFTPPTSDLNGIVGGKQAGVGMENLSIAGVAPTVQTALVSSCS